MYIFYNKKKPNASLVAKIFRAPRNNFKLFKTLKSVEDSSFKQFIIRY